MDTFHREIQLLERYSARQAAVLIRIASGTTISQTARELEMSRSTIYRLLEDPQFRVAVIEEQRHLIATAVIEKRCLRYRTKVLRAVIRCLARTEGGSSRLARFKKTLDTIDEQSGMNALP